MPPFISSLLSSSSTGHADQSQPRRPSPSHIHTAISSFNAVGAVGRLAFLGATLVREATRRQDAAIEHQRHRGSRSSR